MKRSNRYSGEDGKATWKELDKITRFGYSMSNIFSDWLDLMLNALLSLSDNMKRDNLLEKFRNNNLDGEYEDRYMEIVGRYNGERDQRKHGERPVDYFAEAWSLLVLETREKHKDILGQIFMDRITFGENGQFYTPDSITDMMGKIVGLQAGNSVSDCCCGSGRMLISASKENPDIKVYGMDVDRRCAIMAVLNMWLFDLNAEITWGDALSLEIHKTWNIRKGGYVWEAKRR